MEAFYSFLARKILFIYFFDLLSRNLSNFYEFAQSIRQVSEQVTLRISNWDEGTTISLLRRQDEISVYLSFSRLGENSITPQRNKANIWSVFANCITERGKIVCFSTFRHASYEWKSSSGSFCFRLVWRTSIDCIGEIFTTLFKASRNERNWYR